MVSEVLFDERDAADIPAGALILPIAEEDTHPEEIAGLDGRVAGQIRKIISRGEFSGRHAQQCLIHADGIPAERILLSGLGSRKDITPEGLRRAGAKTTALIRDSGISDCVLSASSFDFLPDGFHGHNPPLFYFLEGGLLGLYQYREFRSQEEDKKPPTLIVSGMKGSFPVSWLDACVEAACLVRDLVNLPSNLKTPPLFAQRVQALIGGGLKMRVLGLAELEQEAMEAYLAVGRGSANHPRFIIIEHEGSQGAPIVCIGKSVTFDSGGISLKPAEGMEKMKYDMAGGAAVLAALIAADKLAIPRHIVGILPLTENLPGGRAMRPGDVVKGISGRTIEIVSTDAEGRLSLADAMGYALKHLNPRLIIDIATLTGACSVALGQEAIAMMGNDQGLMDEIRAASEEVYERVWQMPLFEEYGDLIRSDIADLKNSGGRKGSLVSAGFFLKEFAGKTPWVHLDIAGTAWISKGKPYCPKGATGIGARLLLQFLKEFRQ